MPMGDNIREEEQAKVDGLRAVNRMLREQNRVLDGALRLVLESWVNGRKVRDGIGQEVLVTAQAALTATSQPVRQKRSYSHHPAFDEYGEHR